MPVVEVGIVGTAPMPAPGGDRFPDGPRRHDGGNAGKNRNFHDTIRNEDNPK